MKRTFRREDWIGTAFGRCMLWAITALQTILMGYIYYEVSYEDTFAMLLMVAAAGLHITVDVICIIAKKIRDYDDFCERLEE